MIPLVLRIQQAIVGTLSGLISKQQALFQHGQCSNTGRAAARNLWAMDPLSKCSWIRQEELPCLEKWKSWGSWGGILNHPMIPMVKWWENVQSMYADQLKPKMAEEVLEISQPLGWEQVEHCLQNTSDQTLDKRATTVWNSSTSTTVKQAIFLDKQSLLQVAASTRSLFREVHGPPTPKGHSLLRNARCKWGLGNQKATKLHKAPQSRCYGRDGDVFQVEVSICVNLEMQSFLRPTQSKGCEVSSRSPDINPLRLVPFESEEELSRRKVARNTTQGTGRPAPLDQSLGQPRLSKCWSDYSEL